MSDKKHLSVNAEDHQKLKELAVNDGRLMSSMFTVILNQYLDSQKKT